MSNNNQADNCEITGIELASGAQLEALDRLADNPLIPDIDDYAEQIVVPVDPLDALLPQQLQTLASRMDYADFDDLLAHVLGAYQRWCQVRVPDGLALACCPKYPDPILFGREDWMVAKSADELALAVIVWFDPLQYPCGDKRPDHYKALSDPSAPCFFERVGESDQLSYLRFPIKNWSFLRAQALRLGLRQLLECSPNHRSGISVHDATDLRKALAEMLEGAGGSVSIGEVEDCFTTGRLQESDQHVLAWMDGRKLGSGTDARVRVIDALRAASSVASMRLSRGSGIGEASHIAVMQAAEHAAWQEALRIGLREIGAIKGEIASATSTGAELLQAQECIQHLYSLYPEYSLYLPEMQGETPHQEV